MKNNPSKKVSLITKFIAMFAIFGVVAMLVSGMLTFAIQTNIYHRECETTLRNITDQLNDLIVDDGEDFVDVLHYYDKMHITADSDGRYQSYFQAFQKRFAERYPNKTYGVDIHFSEMDEELQAAYAEYRLVYWRTVFGQATDSFDLAYTYFIYPDSEPNVVYFIDPIPETQEVNGEEEFVLGFSGAEDPGKYKIMWEAWHSGKNPSGFDVFDNEYGYTYAYYSPVWINNNEVGLVCADISVKKVNNTIIKNVLYQSAGLAAVLLVSILIMVSLLRKIFLYRIVNLEKNIVRYAESKDESLAGVIRDSEQGNDEIKSLSDQFANMITELKEYMENLRHVTMEKERISTELSVATQIQADMLPRIFPPFPERKEFDLYATMDPAKEVGGDFYDFFMVDDDHIALVVADVSGKGVPAALFMVIAKTLIKNRTLMGGSPAEILTDVNNQLCEGNETELFVTVWLAIVQLSTGKGMAANAGHEHPALRHKDGSFELITYRHSPAVATMEGIRFREHEFQLLPGDTVYEYTDGVSEATNANDELFGNDRLIAALNKESDAGVEALLKNVRMEIDRFVKDAPQFDDITMLGFQFYGDGVDDNAEDGRSCGNS